MAQVTSVSQLSDVFPTDWAFQALQSLVERYGCIAGYPDGTFRGRNFATRYELAAALNACLDRISELLAAGDFVTREDLATIQRLQEEFAAELATLRGRVDALEARVTELEENQFSTTTKLRGETNFYIGGITGDDVPSDNDEIIFASRVRLNFDTSFTGEDRLRARLQAGNYVGWPRGSGLPYDSGGFFVGQTDHQFDSGGGFAVSVSRLEYRFPLGDAVTVYIEANGGAITDIVTSVSPFDDTVAGPLTTFAAYNPIYDVGPGNTATGQNIGAGATIDFGDSFQLGFGYLTGRGNDPGDDSGLFNGDYTAFGQLTLSPGDLTVALTYVNAYEGGLGVSGFAPTNVNAYGVSANFGLSDSFFVGGWFTYIDQDAFSSGSYESEIWTYAGYIGISDLLTEGSTLGLIVGVPPYFGDFDDFGSGVYDPALAVQDNTIHAELFYSFAVSDNITITPGVVWLIDPGNTDANEDVVFGGIRTVFSF
jgi:BMFP domain-containing protein YqiC